MDVAFILDKYFKGKENVSITVLMWSRNITRHL